jgi:hypothetical protein
MLPKPVTAFALSAFISIASFTASSAVAAPANVPDSSASTASSQGRSPHHVKHSKKAKMKKSGQLVSLHSAEPKESPKAAPPKVPASMSSKLDLKNAKSHVSTSKKSTIAATGKEVYIGGPTGHGASTKPSSKTAALHASKGPMSKSGRAPARPDSAAPKSESSDSGSDDHPVQVALRGPARIGTKGAAPLKAPCLHDPIDFVRGAETERFSMTQCDGGAAPLATERLSVMVRTENATIPENIASLAKVEGKELAPGIRRVDPGLLSRLQLIADHFAKPGMPERIAIVSG